MQRISSLSREQRRQAALRRSRCRSRMRSTLPWPVQVIWRQQKKLAREIPLLALREGEAKEFEPAND